MSYPLRERISEAFQRFFLRFWRVGMLWYRLTERFTNRHGHRVQRYRTIASILEEVRFPNNYKPDPWRGKFDVMYHPRLIQRWIDEEKPLGDCGSHACYWACALVKNTLADGVYYCTLQMRDLQTNKPSGHAFVVIRQGNELSWIDYDEPTPVGFYMDDVPHSVALKYGARWVGMTYERVLGVHGDDSLRFAREGDYILAPKRPRGQS